MSDLSRDTTIGVLLGGGVESTALVRRYLADGFTVVPVHVHCGLIWDDCESQFIQRFLAANRSDRLLPLIEVHLPLREFLGDHWAVTGIGWPRTGAPSADLEIPLRNLTLLSFALQKLKQHPKLALALGTTADNSYRDGSRDYFDACEQVFGRETGHPIPILTPLIGLHKTDVIRQSDRETLAQSFSCVHPVDGQHCGVCIKCGRRHDSFREAGVVDPTEYAIEERMEGGG